MPYADLHIHTYFSDGSQSPEEVVASAKARGLSVISVCDHNVIDAYERLKTACREAGLSLVQGAEFDVLWGEARLHLLGYHFDPDDEGVRTMLRHSRRELDWVSVEMIRDMERSGEAVSLTDYEGYEMPLGRGGWKGINYLYDRGLAPSVMEATSFHRRYGHYQPKFYAFEDACRVIREAGGVPVLAHPGVYWLERKGQATGPLQARADADVPAYLAQLAALGLGGVECYYPWHDEAFTRTCLAFCEQNGLCVTCGCDGHGTFGRVVEGVTYDIGLLKVEIDRLRLRLRLHEGDTSPSANLP